MSHLGVVPTPSGLTASDIALLVTAIGSLVIGAVSIIVNRKGAAESRLQQEAANELERRSQGYEQMQGIAQERAADLIRKDAEITAMQGRIDNLREENTLLREVTRGQIAIAAEHDILLPPAKGVRDALD